MDRTYETPLYVLIRFIDYDETTDTIQTLTPNSPCLIVNIAGTPCYPVFTTDHTAKTCRDLAGKTDAVVPCDKYRLQKIMSQMQPSFIAIDPSGIPGNPTTFYTALDFLDLIHDPGSCIDDGK